MEVIFLEDVANVANAGDIRKVADGFARNYLIPRKLASIATKETLKHAERLKETARVKRIRETEHLELLAMELDGASIAVSAKMAPTGRFYGAISPAIIAQALTANTGREIDRRLIEVIDAIREPGEYEIILKLAPDISATININAEAEE